MALPRLFEAFKLMRNLPPDSWPASLWLSTPSLIYLLAWCYYVCVSTCPGSVIGKDRVLNELPFMPSTERCPQPIKKSSLIKRSAILINVIKLDLVFLHKTLLSSYLMCIRNSLKGNVRRKMTCNAPYGICRVFTSQVLFQCPPVNPLDWFIVFFTALTDV